MNLKCSKGPRLNNSFEVMHYIVYGMIVELVALVLSVYLQLRQLRLCSLGTTLGYSSWAWNTFFSSLSFTIASEILAASHQRVTQGASGAQFSVGMMDNLENPHHWPRVQQNFDEWERLSRVYLKAQQWRGKLTLWKEKAFKALASGGCWRRTDREA